MFGHKGEAGSTRSVSMNLSKTVDTIIELRSRGDVPDEQVAEHLESLLGAAQINFRAQPVFNHSRALLFAAVFLLAIVFLYAVLRRRHRAAFMSGLAIPLILYLELSAGMHIFTWMTREVSENIFAGFPVQDAAREVVVWANYAESAIRLSGPFAETVWAFLFPVTLVMAILGLWRVAVFFGKLDFEDAHTITMVMGSVCAV